jgi:hypothetical protein
MSLGKHRIEIFMEKCKTDLAVNINKKNKIMPPQLITLVQNLQSLTAQIASIVLSSTAGASNAPQNVQAAYASLQSASATLATDIAATPFVLATVQNDAVNLQSAVTALAAALASPSNP